MTYSYRSGAVVTYVRDDGSPGPGPVVEYKAADGWKVDIRDEGCVEITQYGKAGGASPVVVSWHRIWQISAAS